MGIFRAGVGAFTGVLADQWREFFYCESMPADIMVTKGEHRVGGRSSNTRGEDNIISNGSIIAVADGQCAIIVEQGQVVDICSETGEFVYDQSTEPSLLYGGLSENIKPVFQRIGRRFTFGGDTGKDQRIYYFNTKELVGNKYGTPSPVPFRVVDERAGIDIDIGIRCFGEYSYKITNPILFYTNVTGNVERDYNREEIDGQLKSELMTALQPAFAKISAMGIRYSALPGHTEELAEALNTILSNKWGELRGLEIVSFGVSSVKASDEDESMIKELQRNAAFMDPTRAAAHLVGSQAAAMQSAASNPSAGPAMAFMGMGMAGAAGGMNAQNLYGMGGPAPGGPEGGPAQPQAPAAGVVAGGGAAAATWTCSCGTENTGKFCSNCGNAQPAEAAGWTCPSCGTVNKGKFCSNCGEAKPEGAPLYQCDKCGWEPEDPSNPPKFCPECGDVFDDSDIVE